MPAELDSQQHLRAAEPGFKLTQRLNDLGIRPSQSLSTALCKLATEIPAAILARTLGIHTDVAVTWQRHSAGDWATYAAEVSRRTGSATSDNQTPNRGDHQCSE